MAEPQPDLVADLLRRNSHWVGEAVQVTSTALTIALGEVAESWRLSDPLPDSMPYQVVLDLPSQTWSLTQER